MKEYPKWQGIYFRFKQHQKHFKTLSGSPGYGGLLKAFYTFPSRHTSFYISTLRIQGAMGLLRCAIKLQFSKDRFRDWYRIPVVWLLFNSFVKFMKEKHPNFSVAVSQCIEANICLTLYQLVISWCWTLFCLHTTRFLSWALFRIVNLDCIKLNSKLKNTVQGESGCGIIKLNCFYTNNNLDSVKLSRILVMINHNRGNHNKNTNIINMVVLKLRQ